MIYLNLSWKHEFEIFFFQLFKVLLLEEGGKYLTVLGLGIFLFCR